MEASSIIVSITIIRPLIISVLTTFQHVFDQVSSLLLDN